jgi:hypothetical protein
MKIENLIRIFEKCIPIYQKAVDEKWNYDKIEKHNLKNGLCYFILNTQYILINYLFNVDSYYKNFLNSENYICKSCFHYYLDNKFSRKPLIYRLEFLKQQVKELKKLQKQGYTDV